MVKIVALSPIAIRHKTDQTANFADDVVRLARSRKRLMATIVLYDEDTNKKKSVQCSKWQREPQRHVEQKVHRRPNSDEWQKSIQDLDDGFFRIGELIGFDDGRKALQNGGVVLLEFQISH